ncbi:MAG: branched-chain amino acid ABC transporter permease [Alphaproteobacteria bacterium]|nr:branched-chain amino acid ABC transporter permease [Alphaproteobacteria bacterium]
MNYAFHLLILLDIYIVVALSLNVIVGYVGLLTLAHAGYFALGGYAYALTGYVLGWEFIPSALVGVAVAMGLSLVLSLGSWRFRGDFFVLFSLSVQVVIYTTLRYWAKPGLPHGTLINLTNGDFGFAGIAKPALFGYSFGALPDVAFLFTLFALLATVFSRTLLHSPWGRMLQAIRDDELVARGLGKDVRLAKLQAIGISCGMAGFAGAMFAAHLAFIDPQSAELNESILLLSMVIVGGVGNSVRGPFVGAFILLAIPEILRWIELPNAVAAEVRLITYGVVLVLLMHMRPQGIAGVYRVG